MTTDTDQLGFADLARRVDELRDRVQHSDDHVRSLLEETLDAVTAFNRAGLVTLVGMLRNDPQACEVLYRSMDEPEVMALLVAHDIVHAGRAVDVLRAVEQIRPYLVASSADVEVVSVDDDVVTLRFGGGGCGGVSDELKQGVREVLMTRVPGLRAVEEVAATPTASAQAFVPLTSLTVGP